MHRISLAPVLSATLSRDSCWITSTPVFHAGSRYEPGGFDPQSLGGACQLLGLLKDLHDAPPLRGGHRPGLHETNPVAHTTGVALVVRLVLRGTADDLAVQGVLDAVLD